MRFDDSLDTVLSTQVASPAAIQMMWRQAVDLIGRRRGGRREGAVARLYQIRDDVPQAVRLASARGLERADPPADLAALFLVDDPVVAAPVARTARLSANEWLTLLPEMQPATRGVLRHRRDLPEKVVRALEAFGPTDFALPAAERAGSDVEEPQGLPAIAVSEADVVVGAEPEPAPPPAARDAEVMVSDVVDPVPPPETAEAPELAEAPEATAAPQAAEAADAAETSPAPTFVAPGPSSFVAVAEVARELPIVAEALRRERVDRPAPPPAIDQDFQIAELVARIEAHSRTHERVPLPPVAHPAEQAAPTHFRFETDAAGVIRWCEGTARGAIIGLSLSAGRDGAPAVTDASAAGALARRARFADARLIVPGSSVAAGTWRISGIPAFDHASGRFTGYRGTARRPRADEEPAARVATTATDALRQLVHELRTPTNAISGFAEMIAHELLGPVPPAYREQAAAIRDQSAGLLGAIDDLDTAARIESGSLELRADAVQLAELLSRIVRELEPLCALRGSAIALEVANGVQVMADPRALERLFSRLLAALIASTARGERVDGRFTTDDDGVRCELTRPAGLTNVGGALLSADAEAGSDEGGPLLGAGFAFRLAQRLASELGGTLVIGPERLTLRLPAAVNRDMGQATV